MHAGRVNVALVGATILVMLVHGDQVMTGAYSGAKCRNLLLGGGGA